MSFHGVQIERPSVNNLAILNTVFQMMYHRKVSKKNSTKSMTYIIVSVNAAWFVQSAFEKNRSEHPWIFIPTMT